MRAIEIALSGNESVFLCFRDGQAMPRDPFSQCVLCYSLHL